MTARVCVLGSLGRMGRAVIEAAQGRGDVVVSAAIDRDGDMAASFAASDVYVDFTTPDATLAAARAARERKTAAVVGTTGLSAEHERAIAELAQVAPVVVAANFSLGVNLVLGLVKQAARVLGPDWDAEVVETHHKAKRDAPSGTALLLRDAMAGAGYRRPIDVSSTRAGAIPGTHTIGFDAASDTIELTHTARDRRGFAAGALVAAKWIAGRRGWFTMQDVLRG